jgi:hypothetical protein
MSTIEDILDSWEHTHASGECQTRELEEGSRCPFCEMRRRGMSLSDLLESRAEAT